MRHFLLGVIVVAFAMGWLGAAVAADREVTVTPLEYTVPMPLTFGPTGGAVNCQVGNLNPAAWAISNFVSAPEDYKLAFDPMTTCTVCPVGFKVTKVHAYLQFAAACQVVLSVDVEDAVYQGPDCPAPGPVVCASPLYTVTIPAAGMYDIAIPITCDCVPIGRDYLLSVHFESHTRVPALITDAGPAVLCLNWNDYGTGWYDIFAAFPTWPGQLKFFADAECCTPPVPADEKTWGAVKDLYEE